MVGPHRADREDRQQRNTGGEQPNRGLLNRPTGPQTPGKIAKPGSPRQRKKGKFEGIIRSAARPEGDGQHKEKNDQNEAVKPHLTRLIFVTDPMARPST